MLNEVIQANQMVFMNFCYIEHYGASFGYDIDAKRTISNISNGYSMYIDYKQKKTICAIAALVSNGHFS